MAAVRGLAHEQGVAVLLATHLAEEVKVADRMMLLAIWARCVLAAPPKTLWRRRTETICMLYEEVFKHLGRPALKINTSDAGVCMTVLQRDETVAVQWSEIWAFLTMPLRQIASLIIKYLIYSYMPALTRAGLVYRE